SRQLWGHDRGPVRGALGSDETEWYTPPDIIALARAVLDTIDLDPASSVKAQRIVRAARYLTHTDDGLKKEWHGNVWLNPPFCQPLIENFADKMIAEVEAGRVKQAITLTNSYSDRGWFQKLGAVAAALCLSKGRIRFVNPNGELAAPQPGQAF